MSNFMNDEAENGNELSGLFDQYKKSHETKKRFSLEELSKQYFTPRNQSEVFRFLPQHEGQRFFEEAHFHQVKINGKWKKLYCAKHNDNAECAMCDLADKLYKMQDKSIIGKKDEELTQEQKAIKVKNTQIYEEYKKWVSNKFYVSKGIDKGALKDGVKFWRFKHNKLKKGVLDRLMPVIEHYFKTTKNNFTDPNKGCDFILTVSDSMMNNGNTYKEVSSILPDGPKQISDDQTFNNTVLSDRKTWRDVYKKSAPPLLDYNEFLKLVIQNKAPYFDMKDPNNKRWVYPGNPELEAKANDKNRNRQANEEEHLDEDDILSGSGSANDYLSGLMNNAPAAVPTSQPVAIGGTLSNDNRPVQQAQPSAPVMQQAPQQQNTGSFNPLQSAIDDLPF